MAVIDSYSESNFDTSLGVNTSTTVESLGQSFTGDGSVLDSAQFYAKKNGTPTGTLNAYIYAHSGTFGSSSVPTGSPLAVSDNFDVATGLTGSNALVTFTFSGANRITLSAATNYCVVVGAGGSFSDANSPAFGIDTTSPTHGGNFFSGDQARTAFGAISVIDLCFYVNGTPAPAGHPTMRRFGGVPGMGQGQSFAGRSW